MEWIPQTDSVSALKDAFRAVRAVLFHFLLQLLRRNYFVYQSHLQGFFCSVLLAKEPYFPGFFSPTIRAR